MVLNRGRCGSCGAHLPLKRSPEKEEIATDSGYIEKYPYKYEVLSDI